MSSHHFIAARRALTIAALALLLATFVLARMPWFTLEISAANPTGGCADVEIAAGQASDCIKRSFNAFDLAEAAKAADQAARMDGRGGGFVNSLALPTSVGGWPAAVALPMAALTLAFIGAALRRVIPAGLGLLILSMANPKVSDTDAFMRHPDNLTEGVDLSWAYTIFGGPVWRGTTVVVVVAFGVCLANWFVNRPPNPLQRMIAFAVASARSAMPAAAGVDTDGDVKTR